MLIAMRTLSPSIVPPLSRFPSSQSIQSISKLLASPCNRTWRDIFTISNWGFQKERRRKEVDEFRTESFRRRSIVSQSRRGSE